MFIISSSYSASTETGHERVLKSGGTTTEASQGSANNEEFLRCLEHGFVAHVRDGATHLLGGLWGQQRCVRAGRVAQLISPGEGVETTGVCREQLHSNLKYFRCCSNRLGVPVGVGKFPVWLPR